MWKGFVEIYGPRWAETNGNDPLGKDAKENRRDHWLEEIKFISWPQLKAAMHKFRRHSKPNDFWLPDLPTFLAFTGKADPNRGVPATPRVALHRIKTYANFRFFRFLLANKTSLVCVPAMVSEMTKIVDALIEVDAEGIKTDDKAINELLLAAWKKVWIEETQAERDAVSDYVAKHHHVPGAGWNYEDAEASI